MAAAYCAARTGAGSGSSITSSPAWCRLSPSASRASSSPGRLELYVTCTFVCVAAILLVPALALWRNAGPVRHGRTSVQIHEWADLRSWPSSALSRVLIARDRLTAIVSLGIQGFSVAHHLPAVRRARSLLHPVHGRDALGRHPGAGDDPASGCRRPIGGRSARSCLTAPMAIACGTRLCAASDEGDRRRPSTTR